MSAQASEQKQFLKESVETLKSEEALSNKLVFVTHRQTKEEKAVLTEGQRRILDSHLTYLYKLANNNFNHRHVGQRCQMLRDFATKYKSGFPWENNEALKKHATPVLVSYAEAIANRLEEVEKVKFGRDLGRIDGPAPAQKA